VYIFLSLAFLVCAYLIILNLIILKTVSEKYILEVPHCVIMQLFLLHFSWVHISLNTYSSDMLRLWSYLTAYKRRNGIKQMRVWRAAELGSSAPSYGTEQLNRTLIRTWDHSQEASAESHLNGDTRDNPRFNWTREAWNFNSLCWVRLVISETLSSALSRGMWCQRSRVGDAVATRRTMWSELHRRLS
jgi:hypothetical protein